MPTIIDALVVTLGLDSAKFKQGSKETDVALKKTSAAANKFSKDMEAWGKTAAGAIAKLRNEALALLGVFTAGVGIKNFTVNTIESAATLGRMSDNLQISTQRLSAYELAARKTGAASGSMTAQLKANQQQIAAARLGMYEGTTQRGFMFGLKPGDLKDAQTLFAGQSRIIRDTYKTDPGRARFIASQIGVGDDVFNFAKQGPKSIDAQVEAAKRLSKWTKQDADNAILLDNKFMILGQTFTYTGSKILFALVPSFDKIIGLLQKLADWILDHKDDINDWISKAVDWIGKAIDKANEWAKALGGWKTVLIALAGLKILSMLSPLMTLATTLGSIGASLGAIGLAGPAALVALAGLAGAAALALHSEKLNTGEQDQLDALRNPAANIAAQKDMVRKLQARGLSQNSAVALVANFQRESGLNSSAVGDNGKAFGLGQWHPDRQADFKALYGLDIRKATSDQQLDFAVHELTKGKYSSVGALAAAAGSPQAAAGILSRKYEIPAASDSEAQKRAALAGVLHGSLDRDMHGTNGNPNAIGQILPLNTVNYPDHGPVTYAGNTTNEVNVNGPINIQTLATDAPGIARDIGKSLNKLTLASQANTGLQ